METYSFSDLLARGLQSDFSQDRFRLWMGFWEIFSFGRMCLLWKFVLKNTLDRLSVIQTDTRQASTRTVTQTDRETDRQTDRQTDR